MEAPMPDNSRPLTTPVMAGVAPDIHVLHYGCMRGGYVYLMTSAPNGILYVGVTNGSCPARLRTPERNPRWIHQALCAQAPGLLRTPRRNPGRDSARTQHQALAAQMESAADTGWQSRVERPVRFDHVVEERGWPGRRREAKLRRPPGHDGEWQL